MSIPIPENNPERLAASSPAVAWWLDWLKYLYLTVLVVVELAWMGFLGWAAWKLLSPNH